MAPGVGRRARKIVPPLRRNLQADPVLGPISTNDVIAAIGGITSTKPIQNGPIGVGKLKSEGVVNPYP